MLQEIIAYLQDLQNTIVQSLEALDGSARFQSDRWLREEGGGGDSRIIQNGAVFEKGGVNFSHVHGPMPAVLRSEERSAEHFHATGVSLVIHPQNPYVPIVHMNVRYFEMDNGRYWFGGGIDLTPAYPFEDDCRFFHQQMKKACDSFDLEAWPKYKAWCDEYFTIQHRQEMRGIGGIFYDHLSESEKHSKADIFRFMQSVGNSFVPTYTEIVERRWQLPYGEEQKYWQKIRRGRYAEFNLVYDRGTRFGLETNGRIESILMSLPPEAVWTYQHTPVAGSPEADALTWYQARPYSF